jgi:ribosomal protein S18 acetylase RimI-like enzyme
VTREERRSAGAAGIGPTADPFPPGIRAAVAADLPALVAVQATSLPAPDAGFLRASVRTGLAFAAVEPGAGDPVGYALHTADERAAYVVELAVAPDHRRRGHGRRLLDTVAAAHPDCERLRLTTRADNEGARAFYDRAGFRAVRRLPDHYDHEDGAVDGVLLVRDL